jgi:RNA polymerase sigma-70 factor (sigma-E family)
MIQLLRGTRAKAEFDQFVASCGEELLRTAYLVVWDLAEAEDLVQEALLAIAKRWPRVRAMDHPRAYARKVLVNLALDGSKRRTRQRQELDDRGFQEDRVDDASGHELMRIYERSELFGALGTLPPRQRAVLVLRYFLDLSEIDVAAALGCTVGTVKSTASRGLARLERELGSPASAQTRSAQR